MPYFEQLSANLFRVRGRVHGYILRNGSNALSIDPGPGGWIDHLDEISVQRIDWILATHHHRDTLQNAGALIGRGAKLAAPAKEKHLVSEVDRFWKMARTLSLYHCGSEFFSLREPVPISVPIGEAQELNLAGIKLQAVELGGHTPGSHAFITELDGKRLVFMGDNIAAPGTVHDLVDFHYEYHGFTQGTGTLRERLPRIRDARPDVLLPAHGEPIAADTVERALQQLDDNLKRHMTAVTPNRLPRPKDEIRQVGPHVFFVGMTTYMIIADSGKAFVWDYGYVPDGRIDQLKKDFGLKQLDVITFSHYHDDHICRATEAAHLVTGHDHPRGAQLWCHRTLYDILTRPLAWRLPAMSPQPLLIDRVYGDETIEWEGIDLSFFEFPGQTYYHVGMTAKLDSKVYAFTGDNIWAKADLSRPINGPIIPRNRYFVGKGHVYCAERLLERNVDTLCPAHADAYSVTRADLEGYREWAREAEDAIRALSPQTPLGTDPWWCRFDPFHIELARRRPSEFRIVIESPFERATQIRIRPAVSGAFQIEPAERTLEAGARQNAAAEFSIRATTDLSPGERIPIAANLTVDGVDFGELSEGLIVVPPHR